MTCRFEVTATHVQPYDSGTSLSVTVSGDLTTPRGTPAYVKVFVEIPSSGDDEGDLNRIQNTLRSKKFYAQMRSSLHAL